MSNNNVLRFRAQTPAVELKPTPNLPSKLHPRVRRRRLIWLLLMVSFVGWCATQLVVQQMRVWDKEELLHKRQQELATTQNTTKQLVKEIKQFRDYDYLMEQAHKLGYGKPGEKNVQIEGE